MANPTYLDGLKIKVGSMESLAKLAGVRDITDSGSSTVDTQYYHGDGGYANSIKTKRLIKYTVTCDRVEGDPANDALFAIRDAVGAEAEGTFEYDHSDEKTADTAAGIFDVTSTKGGGERTPLNFDIYCQGKPSKTTVSSLSLD